MPLELNMQKLDRKPRPGNPKLTKAQSAQKVAMPDREEVTETPLVDLIKLRDDLAASANAAWKKTIEACIETGRILNKAKRLVGHGNWTQFVEKLDFGQRTAECLMEIAEHPVLSNSKHASNLPRSWSTLYRMTSLNESELETLLDNGSINCETQRQQVDELIERANKRGLYKYEDVVRGLATLNKFMIKWPHITENRDLVHEVSQSLLEVPGFIEYEDAAGLDDLPKLCAWLTNLHQACDELIQQWLREDDDSARESESEPTGVRLGFAGLPLAKKKRRKRRPQRDTTAEG
jgi:Protein of unknown function (DUF3102)